VLLLLRVHWVQTAGVKLWEGDLARQPVIQTVEGAPLIIPPQKEGNMAVRQDQIEQAIEA